MITTVLSRIPIASEGFATRRYGFQGERDCLSPDTLAFLIASRPAGVSTNKKLCNLSENVPSDRDRDRDFRISVGGEEEEE